MTETKQVPPDAFENAVTLHCKKETTLDDVKKAINQAVDEKRPLMITNINLVLTRSGEVNFKDSFGNEVKEGTRIKILSNYNYPHWNNKSATVIWDSKHGQFQFVFDDDKSKIGHDFWGIHKFKVD